MRSRVFDGFFLSIYCVLLMVVTISTQQKFPSSGNSEELFEGDIKLTPQQKKAVENAIKNKGSIESGATTYGLTNVYPAWDNGVVIYEYASSITSFHTRGIEAAMREWTSKTGGCITFQRRSTERNYLQFFVGNGCWGHIGKPNGRSQISVGRGCEKQNVMAHEIGHVLGFWHEQSRTDRDSYIKILWENVPNNFREAFAKYGRDKLDSLGVPYDYTSIMHYPWNAFSTTGRDTVRPIRKVPAPGPYVGVSASDVKQARLFYKCGGSPPVATKIPPVITTKPPPVTRCVTETETVSFNHNYNANCRDMNRYCRSWASRGECRTNQRYMKQNCCRSCRGGTTSGSCTDLSYSCSGWAARGECQRNPSYMSRYCRKSCKHCGTKVITKRKCYTLPPPQTTTTTEGWITPPLPKKTSTTEEWVTPPLPTTEQTTTEGFVTPPLPMKTTTEWFVTSTGVPPTTLKPPPTQKDCSKGMTNMLIPNRTVVPDNLLTASTIESERHAAKFGRLIQKADSESVGAWCAGIQDENQYFQVEMENVTMVGALMIQGRPSKREKKYQKFVRKFEIEWSLDNEIWAHVNHRFDGNTDGGTVKNVKFEVPILTRYIRIRPKEWQNMICLRLELLICRSE